MLLTQAGDSLPPLFSSFTVDFKIAISKSEQNRDFTVDFKIAISKSEQNPDFKIRTKSEQNPDFKIRTKPSSRVLRLGDWEVDMAGKSSRRWNRKGAQNAPI
ncbi:hypothetical protein L2E82_20449 [Cichorium intybus]|uniref:Uncharacterized protein n=1 Tax=Cichorium intybus TaxID=13427 RepID=A0ACB9DTN3_CICIN|nr:hypothetical protein L2E82_20449 [Cichorium intybus]